MGRCEQGSEREGGRAGAGAGGRRPPLASPVLVFFLGGANPGSSKLLGCKVGGWLGVPGSLGSVALARLRSAEAEGVFTQSGCLDKTVRLTDPRVPRAKERGGGGGAGRLPLWGQCRLGRPPLEECRGARAGEHRSRQTERERERCSAMPSTFLDSSGSGVARILVWLGAAVSNRAPSGYAEARTSRISQT